MIAVILAVLALVGISGLVRQAKASQRHLIVRFLHVQAAAADHRSQDLAGDDMRREWWESLVLESMAAQIVEGRHEAKPATPVRKLLRRVLG